MTEPQPSVSGRKLSHEDGLGLQVLDVLGREPNENVTLEIPVEGPANREPGSIVEPAIAERPAPVEL